MSSTSTLPWLARAPAPAAARRGSSRRRRIPVHRLRRLLTALLVGIAVWLAITVVRLGPPAHTVVTVTSSLPAGHALTEADLATVQVERSVVPDGAVTGPGDATGRRLARAVTARSILDTGDLATTREIRDTERALHVPVPDPGALRALRPGDHVDLVEAGAGRVVGHDVRVLAVDEPDTEKSGHGLLVAIREADITGLVPAMASGGPGITPVLRTG